jgi:hypothetical protein
VSATRYILLPALLLLCGCTPFALWMSERGKEREEHRVVALPDFYDPAGEMPPYDGPHPSQIGWRPDPGDYPILPGRVGPIDRSLGPLQYPFACQTQESGLGQPQVDNDQGWGTAVTHRGQVIGYSKDCLVPTRVEYYYKSVERGRLLPYDSDTPQDDIDVVDRDGEALPFVVLVERGTINRYIYAIAMLTTPDLHPEAHLTLWNKRLLYQFRGGVGIGKKQGRGSVSTATRDAMGALAAGYAVAFSTGTYTSTHYDMLRAGHTAAMVKAQFEAAYGKPEFTIGIGGSGGAVQQYLAAQNHPGLLDGLIPIYSYPDMITQTNWALDCELLEHYFDATSGNRRWRRQEERTAVMGLSASNSVENPFNSIHRWSRLRRLDWDWPGRGGTECALAWRGLTALTGNPRFLSDHRRYARDVVKRERWTHWHDLRNIYGVGSDGHDNRTWSNAGVQYGLHALRSGAISPEEFLHLNSSIGTWKAPRDMESERYWVASGPHARRPRLADVSIWSAHNMKANRRGQAKVKHFRPDSTRTPPVAPRTRSDVAPVQAAFRAGQVYLGQVTLPTLDVRHYLDPILDMHHSFASLSVRARMEAAGTDTGNHVIWMAEPYYDFIADSLAVMDAWLSGERPERAVDSCFDADGHVIARGEGVWDGAWNEREDGVCMQRFPPFQSPRNVAGEPMTGDVFRCALEDVDEFTRAGGYGPVDMEPYLRHLRRVFPDGVCNYEEVEPYRPSLVELLTPDLGDSAELARGE